MIPLPRHRTKEKEADPYKRVGRPALLRGRAKSIGKPLVSLLELLGMT
jgi:hypothetical protein